MPVDNDSLSASEVTSVSSSSSQSTIHSQSMTLEPIKPTPPSNDSKVIDPTVILKSMVDPKSGFYGLLCSEDNGVNWVYEYGVKGKAYHQRDIDRISEIPFDKIKMRSPSKAVFSFIVDDEGILKVTDSNGNVVSQTVNSTVLSEMQSRIDELQKQVASKSDDTSEKEGDKP